MNDTGEMKERKKKDLKVTMAHVLQAVKWARKKSKTIGGHRVEYDQRSYSKADEECGTRCCIWGAAYLIANDETTENGPVSAWSEQSRHHSFLSDLFGENGQRTYGHCRDPKGDEFYLSLVEHSARSKMGLS